MRRELFKVFSAETSKSVTQIDLFTSLKEYFSDETFSWSSSHTQCKQVCEPDELIVCIELVLSKCEHREMFLGYIRMFSFWK